MDPNSQGSVTGKDVADWVAAHAGSGAAPAESAVTFTDITTNDVSSTKHGYTPKSGADATTFLNGAATPAYAAVKDSDLSTSDVTTNNVTSTKHGFAPKSAADATKFLNSAATPAYAQVKDSDLVFTDVTTNNATSSQHGFVKKLSNASTDYFGGDGNYTALPVQAANTVTLTNKRVTKRSGTTASSATPTINTDNVDFYSLTAQSAAITSFTTNLSGTPTVGQSLWVAITDNGTARAITWGASFEASGTVALPTTTVISTRLDVGFVWNDATTKWRCVAVA